MVPGKRPSAALPLDYFSSFLTNPFIGMKQFILSITGINDVYQQIADCVRGDKISVCNVCKNGAAFRQLCDVSKSSLV